MVRRRCNRRGAAMAQHGRVTVELTPNQRIEFRPRSVQNVLLPPVSAMQVDVPGYPWQAVAHLMEHQAWTISDYESGAALGRGTSMRSALVASMENVGRHDITQLTSKRDAFLKSIALTQEEKPCAKSVK
jgi:hypothetical protein